IVPVDQLRLAHVAEDRLDLAGRPAHDAARFVGGVVREAARHLAPAGLEAGDYFAAQERSRDLDHADRQEHSAPSRERLSPAAPQPGALRRPPGRPPPAPAPTRSGPLTVGWRGSHCLRAASGTVAALSR